MINFTLIQNLYYNYINMKKIGILIFALYLVSCASGKKQMVKLTNKVYIGMTIQEFNKVIPNKRLVEMTKEVTIYKVERRVWYDSDGSGSDYKFFYFVDGKLSEMNEGEQPQERIQIEHIEKKSN